jgi:hypothetical protein
MSELYPLTVEQLAGVIANAQAESVETVKIQLFDKTYDLSHAQIIPFRTHSDLVLFASHGVMSTKKVCPKPVHGGKREDAGRPKVQEKRKILAIREIVASWQEKVKPYRELIPKKQVAYSMVIKLLDSIEKADREFLLDTELQTLLEGGFYG